ncbi:amino acid permease [Sunxiuqinia elliptica]|uniref:Amino acid transporter n=1 Tax=Sunxiuqinia elliptica TaxID=655355 RepID=A0A1I2CP25_9BACT|nr:amino acid permease [Sunxiuqinia elliptica]SFE69543.1 Amino acid transporter [Sunxiuqinia elliptica]
MGTTKKEFGTAPVFFTAMSTILGAILFLRFGYGVGTLGFWGVVLIILLGHLVTIPTALAISEIATNKRVEGGGEYFIISRSFGLNIGATVGIALYLSQAISVAFYIIAFTESFEFLFQYIEVNYNFVLPRQAISLPAMAGLSYLILKKGAAMGVKTLYIIVGILALALILFFAGTTDYYEANTFSIFSAEMRNMNQFFIVFAIIFPAFTGMTAGVGLSGELKNPSKAIPLGTTLATFSGMIVYLFIAWKLASSASQTDLLEEQLIMGKIALGGSIIIPIGLAASTLSSAIGSIMVAPRTLQALATDRSFPGIRVNAFLKINDKKTGEPINASIVTILIAFIFVAAGNVNAVAGIISMFFMVTYGSLCLISFLNHFGSSPSYRPSFRSRWYFSLIGFVTALFVMFKIDALYAFLSLLAMALIYLMVNHYHKDRKGLEIIFINAIFQLNRNLQVYLQNARKRTSYKEWRPSCICISDKTDERKEAFRLLNWISYKYGFGTYIHLIHGYFSKASNKEAKAKLDKLILQFGKIESQVYVDTMISPSYTSAIAQAVQLPGITGLDNNMLIFDNNTNDEDGLKRIIENYGLVNAGNFDVLILRTGLDPIDSDKDIHLWLKRSDEFNANLMILLSFIIYAHPDWKKSAIKIFDISKPGEIENTKTHLQDLIIRGRLPITLKNIEFLEEQDDVSIQEMINQRSADAGLVILGFRGDHLKHQGTPLFQGFNNIDSMLFVNSHDEKVIE